METSSLAEAERLVGVPRPRRRASFAHTARRIAIVGTGDCARIAAKKMLGTARSVRRSLVVVDTRVPNASEAQAVGLNVTGPLAEVPTQTLREMADAFLLAFAPEDAHHAVGATRRLLSEDLDFQVMPETMGCVYHHLIDLGWDEVPVVRIERGAWGAVARVWKRATDVLVAASALTLLLPLMVLVGLMIRLESPGAALFKQNRVGKNGRVFRVLKFRSMADGSHARESELTTSSSADQRFVKIDCDPRVTRLGWILRKSSVDELPQLWNVLLGEMSLVGPRPSQPSEVAQYAPADFTRLLVKPGITGMWQVSGRSNLAFEDAVRLDAIYVREWSPLLDVTILLKTVGVVLRARGAC